MKERIRIATALGYYARATDPKAKTLSAAIEIYALAEYRNDVDCQVAFRKGYQQAEEHLAANHKEARELRELIEWIQKLENEVVRQRRDIHGYLRRQEAIASTPGYMRQMNAGSGGGHSEAIDRDAYASGSGYYAADVVRMDVEPGATIPCSIGSPNIEDGMKPAEEIDDFQKSRVFNISPPPISDPSRYYKWRSPAPAADSETWHMMNVKNKQPLRDSKGAPITFSNYQSCADACRNLEVMGCPDDYAPMLKKP